MLHGHQITNAQDDFCLVVLTYLINCRGGAIQFFGTKRHHDKWLKDTENFLVKGCFAMTELGHGSNVCRLY